MLKSKRKNRKLRRKNLFRYGACLILMQFFLFASAYAQEITVTGTVTDAKTGEALIGVNVVLEGTTQGAITNLDGVYSIDVPDANAVLVFTYIGYTQQNIAVNGRTVIDVVMEAGSTYMDELVVVGYGTARRKDLTGSIASVSSDEITKVPVANAAEAIKGRLPGVKILTTDGSPDAEVVIRVRGGGSITQDNSPLFVVDGFIVSSIKDIPPNDISSITVLKDAASTAIYGSQAANGVILVTTKNPRAGRTEVSYNGYAQFKTLPIERKYDVLSPYEYVMMQYERAIMNSDTELEKFERYYGKYDDLELYQYKRPTDWQEEMFGDAKISQSHNLNISGGNDKTKLRLSLANNKDEGILVGNGYARNAINFKLNHAISNKLTFDASTRITDTRIDGAGTSGSSQLRIKDIITARPVNGIMDEFDIDLTSLDASDDYQSFLLSMTNPRDLVEQDWRQNNTQKYVLNAGVNWEPIENLNLKTSFTGEKEFREILRYYGPLTSQSKQEGNSLPLGTLEDRTKNSFRWLNTANYRFNDLGDHKIDLLLGHEVNLLGGYYSYVRTENFRESMQPDEMFANMDLGTTVLYRRKNYTNTTMVSLFGRANYQYKEKYLLTATLRSDASSKFLKENRLGIFPSLAVAWKLSEEGFLENVSAVNELKLRLSYGETGNNRIDSNAMKFLFESDRNNGPGMGTNDYNSYYKPDGDVLYNPNLIWETTINRNLGLDFSLFNYKVNGNVDLYMNTTKDLLLEKLIPPTSGFPRQYDNLGSTSNKGVELLLNATIIQTGDLYLGANVNFGINKAEIIDLGEVTEMFIQSNWASTDLKDRDDYYLAEGQTIGLIYGYQYDGMYTVDDFESYDAASDTYTLKDGVPDAKNTLGVSSVRPGYMKIKDVSGADGTPDGIIDSQDRGVIGNALPKATGGFGLDARFKGFDASILFNWSYGNDIYNSEKIRYNQLYRTTWGNMISSQDSENRFTYIDVDGSYTGTPGAVVTDLTQLAEMNAGKTMWNGANSFGQATAVVTDWAIEDGSFLRLSNLTLGYTLPERLTDRFGMSQLRVYLAGYNLWLWTKYSGYDPEVSTSRSSSYGDLIMGLDYSSYPRSRSFTVGLNITF